MATVLLAVAAACLVAFLGLVAGAVSASGGSTARPAAGSSAVPPSPVERAWQLLWTARAGVVLARLVLLVLVGLTPAGAVLLVPLAGAGPEVSDVAVLWVLAAVAWLPQLACRRLRERAFALAPTLRPWPRLKANRRMAPGQLGVAALVLAVVSVGPSLVDLRSVNSLLLVDAALILVVLLVFRMRRRHGGLPIAVDPAGQDEEAVGRLRRLRDSLTGVSGEPQVDVTPGRIPGRPVNAYAFPARKTWRVVVAPELLDRLDDAQLTALLAHEIGHTAMRPSMRPRSLAMALLLTAAFGGLGLARAAWNPLTPWLVAGLNQVPADYGSALQTAMAIALGYLIVRLLWPLLLMALRAGEAVADREMVRLTGDGQACADLLEELRAMTGTPRRWTWAHRLLIATHPGADERISAVRGEVAAA